MKANTIIFDLDGTLLDTIDDLGSAVNTLLLRYGRKKRTREEYLRFIGQGSLHLISCAFEEDDPEKIEQYYQEYLTIYLSNIDRRTTAYKDIYSILKQVYIGGYNLLVFTNKPLSAAKLLLKDHFPEVRFKAVIAPDKDNPPKPNPTALLKVMKEFELDPEAIIFVGDSSYDMEVAEKVGIPNRIGCLYGYQDAEKLSLATTLVSSPSQLRKIFNKLSGNKNIVTLLLFSIVNLVFMTICIYLGVIALDSTAKTICFLTAGTIAVYFLTTDSLVLTNKHYLSAWPVFFFSSLLTGITIIYYIFFKDFDGPFNIESKSHLIFFIIALLMFVLSLISFFKIIVYPIKRFKRTMVIKENKKTDYNN